jgi:glucosamine-6-phosphate deaminase
LLSSAHALSDLFLPGTCVPKRLSPDPARISPLEIRVFSDRAKAEDACAEAIARALEAALRRRAPAVALFAWGKTFAREGVGIYDRLSRSHRGQKALADCIAVAGDEWRIAGNDPRSGRACLEKDLFSKAPAKAVHALDGTASDASKECARFDALIRRLGGLDLVILGVGPNGHILFNEPNRRLEANVHPAKPLGAYPEIPSFTNALTVGMDQLVQPRSGILAAFGQEKASALQRGLSGKVDPRCPVSFVQLGNYTIITDRETAKAAGLEALADRSGFTYEKPLR